MNEPDFLSNAPRTARSERWPQRGSAHLQLPQSAVPDETTIAVVEDDVSLRNSLVALLEAYGYRTLQCGTQREAIALIQRDEVSLALLDLRLHGESGLAVLENVRSMGCEIPIIVVSGDTMIESAISALQLGANDYLRKPCAPEILRHRVEAALQRYRLEQANCRMTEEIAQSEALHRFLVASSPDIIFVLDDEGKFSFVSDSAHALLGHPIQDMRGADFFEFVVKEDIEKTESTMRQLRAGEFRTIELRLKHKQPKADHHHHFELTLSSLLHPSPQWRTIHLPGGRGMYGVARDITDKKLAYDKLSYQACHDPLTGLQNRVLFVDRLELAISRARRNRKQLAVIFVDLDHFKLINDTLGHMKGDVVLCQIAERLKACLRESDTLARLGGDEFIVMLPDIHGFDDAGLVAHKIVEDMAKPFSLEGRELFLSSSLGIAMFPENGEDGETLMRHSDIAMYDVKAKGKNGFAFFTQAMNEGSSQRLAMANDLRKALEGGQFDLYYQPQFDVRELRVTGLEALIRWNHPTRGLLTAGEFISIAEDIGMMSKLTRWVLDRACRDLRSWRDRGIKLDKMAINFSPQIIEKKNFIDDLLAMLDQHEIPPSSIEIEITENMPIHNMEATTAKLKALADLGVRIAIDDFGVQYSSLNYLRKLPINTLKIDRAFVMEIRHHHDDSPIIKAIVAIAAGLGLDVVAEGVETAIQAEFLKGLGCQQMQGYFYGHPQPFSVLESMLVH